MLRPRASLWLAALALAAGCWRSAPPSPAPFRIDRVSPVGVTAGEPLLLNESVTIYFSDPVDAFSVTRDTVTVLDEAGHPVPGKPEPGASWVKFTPEPPLSPELTDGSFRPGEVYRLVVAGYPRPDAVCAADGRRLDKVYAFELRTAGPGPHGELPAPLRPPASELPFVLRGYTTPPQLPADAPRMRLHFTLPVLPASARTEAFVIRLARAGGALLQIEPRSVRVMTSPLDPYPGAAIEIDLGTEPRVRDGGFAVTLTPGDILSVALADGDDAVRDLAGNAVLPALEQCWSVVEGATLALLTWPGESGGLVGDDRLWPGFEAQSGRVRPRVRTEAGDGRLGLFRPTRDTVLRPGVPFDRGDGVVVRSSGPSFPFVAIDIPAGVRVRVEGQGTTLLAQGGVRVAGTLELEGATAALPAVQHGSAVDELLELAPVAIVAAGDVTVTGAVVTAIDLPPDRTALIVASAGRIHLDGELPYNTLLCVEHQAERSAPAILGARGQTIARSVTFTYGLAPAAEVVVRAATPWRRMPDDRDGGVLRLVDVDRAIAVTWQTAPADPVDPSGPDMRPERATRPRPVRDGEWVPVDPGSFVRFAVEAALAADHPLPGMEELRLVDR